RADASGAARSRPSAQQLRWPPADERRLPRAGGARGAAAARGAHAPADLLLAELLEIGVERADRAEDLVGGRLLLLARRVRDLRERERLAVLHQHLRELELLPVAHALGAVDRDRHDRGAGLEREPADS